MPTLPVGVGLLITVSNSAFLFLFGSLFSLQETGVANHGIVVGLDADGVSLDEFPHVEKWLKKLLERPGFEKGRHIPQHHSAFDK